MTVRSPLVEVIHPRRQSLVGRMGPRHNRLEVGQDQSVSVLVRRKVYAWNPRLPGTMARSWKTTSFPTQW